MTSATVLTRTRRARTSLPRVDVLRVLLTVLALAPYLLGWVIGAVVSVAVWAWAAVVAGWWDARHRGDG